MNKPTSVDDERQKFEAELEENWLLSRHVKISLYGKMVERLWQAARSSQSETPRAQPGWGHIFNFYTDLNRGFIFSKRVQIAKAMMGAMLSEEARLAAPAEDRPTAYVPSVAAVAASDGASCSLCGAIMSVEGNKAVCRSCGQSTGCAGAEDRPAPTPPEESEPDQTCMKVYKTYGTRIPDLCERKYGHEGMCGPVAAPEKE